ncbi:thiolase family protein [Aliigemmobacter aestuarii]|uniref:Thiolase family protein n=1 Tax=Aliigemmobacter aestuarii TaxID=1445661 RepID=A0A4S3MMQ8_9RHOB|nr:thiolase family protein [Gemmobacter aestuarii]THD82147.1 thiolase family protein [Gemmobacter aestuarii]
MVTILSARRTAVMPRGGAFARLAPHELAAPVIRAVLDDAGITADRVDEVILSNALGGGGNPARVAALAAGLPERVAGISIDQQCAGGLSAIGLGAALIASGQAGVVIAGGAESWSRRPIRLATAPGQPPVAYEQPPFTPWPDRDPDMAEAADALGRSLGISRDWADGWAIESHARARAAADRLAVEILPLEGMGLDGFTRPLTPRLAARAPVVTGAVTAANAAVAADASAFVLLVRDDLVPPRARRAAILAARTLGAAPDQPGLAPVPAIAETLAAAGLRASHLAQAEIMEAYAVQAIACVEGAGIDPAIVNPRGGALARGHPIGASGAILAVRLFHDLAPGATGLAAIASAGGIGAAMVLRGA